jgi:radical SAM protein with 4Fe4S-binding SPASM domain
MQKPPVLVLLQNVQTLALGKYPTLDLDPAMPLGRRLLERLKTFGYENIHLAFIQVSAPWLTPERVQVQLREFANLSSEFAKKSVVFEHAPNRETWAEFNNRIFTWCVSEFPAGRRDPILRLDTDAIFLDPESIQNLALPLPDGILYRSWQGASWEAPACWTHEFCRILETTRHNPPDLHRQVLESPVHPSALPPQIAFGVRTEFLEVFRALEKKPVTEWGHEDLRDLWAKQPHLFRGGLHHVGVELTNEENLPNRLRAPSRLSRRPTGRLSRAHWDALLSGLSDERFQPLSIDFWDFGEPLLHPDAVTFIEEAARHGIRVDLYTNGLLLDEPMADRLISSGLDAIFYRLDGMKPETYGRVSGDTTLYTRAAANLDLLVRRKRELVTSGAVRKPTIAVQITEMAETDEDLDAFFDRYDHRARVTDELRVKNAAAPLEHQILAAIYDKGEPIEYAMLRHDNLFRGRVVRAGGMDTTPLKRFPCRHLREGVYVLWSGEIVACREDVDAEMVLGHVDEDLTRIRNGEKMGTLLGLHEREEWETSPLCRNCSEWYYTFL